MKRIMQRSLSWDIVFIALLYILILLGIKPQTPAVFLLVLMALNLLVVRIRFPALMRGFFIDIALFFAVAFYWAPAFYLAMPAVYLMVRKGQGIQTLFVLPLIMVNDGSDLTLWGLYALAVLAGALIFIWQEEKNTLLNTVDTHREKLFEIQNERANLLSSQSEISRIATYSERDRIAQKLHDNLGHEITAGLLSLKAHKRLIEQGKSDGAVLDTAIRRIEQAASELKQTVHNTKPLTLFSLDVFEAQLERFPADVAFAKTGDLTKLSPHHWQTFNAVLKESLTNALKHSGATSVSVTLEVTAQVARLFVENEDPKPSSIQKQGYGLSFMRARIEALGGSFSVQCGMTFKVIAIIPIQEDSL